MDGTADETAGGGTVADGVVDDGAGGEQRRGEQQPVVVGVDGSGTALRAAVWAADEAALRGAPLRIVHAAPYARASSVGLRRAQSILALGYTVVHRARPDVDAHTERLDEDAPDALAAAAESAQLLVVGMFGGSGVEDLILRSVAIDVSAVASCPVAVVRGHRSATADTRHVLLGVEDVAADAAAVTAAFTDAALHRTGLVLLHAQHHDRDPAPSPPGLERQLEPWRTRYPEVDVEVRSEQASPTDALLEAAVHARLLVVGTRARGTMARIVHGSTSRTVLRGSPCPVVVVRRDARVAEPTGALARPAGAETAPPSGPAGWALHPHGRGEAR
ncbi:MAG TPA: universal stress protein [Pseudonocardia sp.]|nr:universal stress protein [Pseudonocardia sp.]